MEKQSSLDLEPTKQERTSTSTDGQSPSQETSLLNLIWKEPGIESYFVDIGGELSLHHKFTPPFSKEKIKRMQELFDILMVNLMDRGMSYVDTWISEDDEGSMKLVEKLFNFVDTETLKLVKVGDTDFTFRVFRCYFPTDELMKVLEGVRD